MNVYPFIEAERAQQRSVKRACELLTVPRGSMRSCAAKGTGTAASAWPG